METRGNKAGFSLLLLITGLIFALSFFGCSGSIDGNFTSIKNGGEKPGNNGEPIVNEPNDGDGDGKEPDDGKIRITFEVNFSGPKDENITLDETQTLSWLDNDELKLEVAETFDSYQWTYFDIDGISKEVKENLLILFARDFQIGTNSVSLKVTKDSIPYTKIIYFTVN